MDRLEQKHVDFLRVCAGSPNRIHALPIDMDLEDANEMAAQGLLIKYNKPLGPMFCIAAYGTQFVKEQGKDKDTPEMVKLAETFVISKGYTEEAAKQIVQDNGAEVILKSQADEVKQNSQKDISIPTDANGNTVIKPIKN